MKFRLRNLSGSRYTYAQEGVDEVGLALDLAEPAADEGFQHVQGTADVVAQLLLMADQEPRLR
jgi:hypothetical protein